VKGGAFERFPSCTVAVIGDTLLDVYLMGAVHRISPEAPVPVVAVKEKTLTLGGAGNVALNIAGVRGRAVLFSMRGEDDAGAQLVEILRHRGIQDRVVVDTLRFTTTKTRIIGDRQQLLRLDEEETRPLSEPVSGHLISRFEEASASFDVVLLSDYNKGVLTADVCREIIGRCRDAGIPVFVDPKGRDWERYHGATCITPNTSEIQYATGLQVDDDDELLVEASEKLREQHGFEWMLVTRGSKGVCLLGPEADPLFIHATAREVYDVTGAGDTVIAMLAIGVAAGLTFPAASNLANAAAGIVVGKIGSQSVTFEELETALRIDGTHGRSHGNSKVTSHNAAEAQVRAWQATGEKIVFTSGVFEELHAGNVHLLRRARAVGGRVVVGLLDDRADSRVGQDRAYVLSALDCVDLVIVQAASSAETVKMLRPDVIVIAEGDEPAEVYGAEFVEEIRAKLKFVPVLEGYGGPGQPGSDLSQVANS
jgi:D-beta-D-heptose 7-phosphate kinase/D-beta-D-heptose 1-phosphate adenosyltransferase